MRTSTLNIVRFVMWCCLALFHKRETQESLKGRSQHSVNTERYFSLFLPVSAGFPYSRVLAGWRLRKGGPEGTFQLSSFLGFLWREVLSQISSLCPTKSGMNTARWCIFCSWPWGSPSYTASLGSQKRKATDRELYNSSPGMKTVSAGKSLQVSFSCFLSWWLKSAKHILPSIFYLHLNRWYVMTSPIVPSLSWTNFAASLLYPEGRHQGTWVSSM